MGEDGARVRTGLGHGGITCVLQTQFSTFFFVIIITVRIQHLYQILLLFTPYDAQASSAYSALIVTVLSCFSDFNPLKPQTKIAADDFLIFYFYVLKKIWLDFSCESSA